jgi:hypothetical protein
MEYQPKVTQELLKEIYTQYENVKEVDLFPKKTEGREDLVVKIGDQYNKYLALKSGKSLKDCLEEYRNMEKSDSEDSETE